MSVTRVVLVVSSLLAALGAAPRTASAQETTFIALGSDADEVVGHGSDTYFDATTADFSVNHTSGVHRHFITILIRPKDGSPAWSMAFTTQEHPNRSAANIMRQRRRDTRRRRSASTAPGASCRRRVGSFIIHELRLALPAHVGFCGARWTSTPAAQVLAAACTVRSGSIHLSRGPTWATSGCRRCHPSRQAHRFASPSRPIRASRSNSSSSDTRCRPVNGR